MKHNEYKDLLILALYDELSDKERLQLNEHLIECSECQAEFDELKKMHALVDATEETGPEDELLDEARTEMRVLLRRGGFETDNRSGFRDKISAAFNKGFRPAYAAAATLLIGMLTGYLLFGSHPGTEGSGDGTIVKPVGEKNGYFDDGTRIENIHFTDSDPSDGEVEFTFQATKTIKMRGNINDEQIQRVLIHSLLTDENPGTRLRSINVMSKEKRSVLTDKDLEKAFIQVAKYDENPGVRLEAVRNLQELPYDNRIKETFLYVLKNDTSSGIRIEAMNGLTQAFEKGYKVDDDVISVFKEKLENDNNNYIRIRAKSIIEENEI